MAHIEIGDSGGTVEAARNGARIAGHVRRAQMMVVAAGLAAFGIVAVAATMMTTLL